MTEETPVAVAEPAAPRSRRGLFIGLGLVLVVALAGAAYLAGRFARPPATSGAGPQGMGMVGQQSGAGVASGGPGGDAVTIQIHVTPAPELPKLPPEVVGLFVSRDDNRLFIGTGNVGMTLNEGGTVTRSGGDGPQVEVVITADTLVYQETTQLDPSQPPQDNTIQQTVAPGSVDDLTADTGVSVWGRRTGDRVVADVLLYSRPMVFKAPGP